MTSQLVVDAVEQSNWTRKRDGKDLNGLTAHYDHRSRYLSVAYTEHLDAAEIKPSIGTVRSSNDNTLAESVNELYNRSSSSQASPGRASRTARWRPPNGSPNSTTAACSPSTTTHLPKPKRPTTTTTRAQQPLKTQAGATGHAGAVQNAERGNQLVVAPFREVVPGDVLLSHTVSRAVPLALKGLASGFGMEPGVSLSLWSPKLYGDTGTPLGTARPVNGCAVVGVPDRISGTAQWTRVPPLRVGSSLCSSPRPISTGQLHVLPRFHFLPINPVVSPGALPG